MAAGRQVVVLADHTKLGHDTMCQTVPSDRIDVLVTDPARDPDGDPPAAVAGIDVQVAALDVDRASDRRRSTAPHALDNS